MLKTDLKNVQSTRNVKNCILACFASDERKFGLFVSKKQKKKIKLEKKSRLTANNHFECANKALFTTNSIA